MERVTKDEYVKRLFTAEKDFSLVNSLISTSGHLVMEPEQCWPDACLLTVANVLQCYLCLYIFV